MDVAADAAAISRAMADLPPMQRACFELVAIRQCAPSEVALMHDIAESTVRQHVFRARARLRKLLDHA
jgi:DNA-directed RNA polymerase specialized sigma24 family protein